LVNIARVHRVPLYPVSTGRNWGYGDGRPVVDGCVVVDLSRMNRIVSLDPELGLVTVEPGVTQGQLRQYLDEHRLPFMVPTTGAGPQGSLLGNALERGYGLAPVSDHFQAVMALEAVLPDGTLYRSAISEQGAALADQAYKWGFGPYLDGLFSQGSFGIVTRATLSLVREPEAMEAFFFWIERFEDLEGAIGPVRTLLQQAGSSIGGLKIMSGHVAGIYAGSGDRRRSAWLGSGYVAGPRELNAAARRLVTRILRPHVSRLIVVPTWLPAWLDGMLGPLLATRFEGLAAMLRGARGNIDLMTGRPSEVGLPAAYRTAPPTGPLDPGRDGAGLHWYPPWSR